MAKGVSGRASEIILRCLLCQTAEEENCDSASSFDSQKWNLKRKQEAVVRPLDIGK